MKPVREIPRRFARLYPITLGWIAFASTSALVLQVVEMVRHR